MQPVALSVVSAARFRSESASRDGRLGALSAFGSFPSLFSEFPMCTRSLSSVLCLLQAVCLLAFSPGLAAQSVSLTSPPSSVTAGQRVTVRVSHNLATSGALRVQFYNDKWNGVASTGLVNISSGNRSRDMTLTIPAGTPTGGGHIWHAELFNSQSQKVKQAFGYGVTVGGAATSAASVSFASTPASVTAGSTYNIKVDHNLSTTGIVQVQFFTSGWQRLAAKHVNVSAGSGQTTLAVRIPSGTAAGSSYRWQAVLYNRSWRKQKDTVRNGVSVASNSGGTNVGIGGEFIPAGSWQIQWADEFNSGANQKLKPTRWFPFLKTNSDEQPYQGKTGEYPLRAENGSAWAWFTSTSFDRKMADGDPTYWMQNGKLVLRAVMDKRSG